MSDKIALKWGRLKAWKIKSEPALRALRKLAEAEQPGGAGLMSSKNSDEHRRALCELIDAADCETVYNDWDCTHMSKEEAKEYVMEYPR